MKLSITWEENPEGDRRILLLPARALRLWLFVEGLDGEPVSSACELQVTLRDTRHVRWLSWLRRRVPLGRAEAERKKLEAVRVEEGKPGFSISGLPNRWLPYWIDCRAALETGAHEVASLYVVPYGNRLISLASLLLAALLAAYMSWLLLNLSSEALPDGTATMAATVTGIMSPLLGVVAPLVSSTVRRRALDAIWTGAVLLVAVVCSVLVHRYQKPVYIENNAPTALDALLHGKQLVIEPGSAAVVSRARLEDDFRQHCLDEGACDGLRDEHWFKTGNYCVERQGSEAAGQCLTWRAADWAAKLQRWLALGETLRFGCKAVDDLDPESLEAWKRSGSCKLDPELEVPKDLGAYLAARRKPVKATAGEEPRTSCDGPGGEVRMRPFRTSPSSARRAGELRPLEVWWPPSAANAASLPTWKLAGSAEVGEVSIVPGEAPEGCAAPYASACASGAVAGRACSQLYAPQGEISAVLERGGQKLGSLWCSGSAARLLAARARSKLLNLRVLKTSEELFSRYETASADLADWVFWCEPEEASALRAEVTLAGDWQPLEDWKIEVPAGSNVTGLDVNVAARGLWGSLDCPGSATGRVLRLIEVEDRAQRAVVFAEQRGTGVKWVRYTETSLYPSWVWFCSAATAPSTQELAVRLNDGQAGRVKLDGHLTESTGVPCLIDPVSKQRVGRARPERYTSAAKAKFSARETLDKWPQRGCDAARSYLSSIEGHR